MVRICMKHPGKLFIGGLGALAFAAFFSTPQITHGQAADEQQAIAQLAAEISAQQAKIVENQKAIETKLATIEEDLRIAKIYVSRGGGPNKK
jgi:Tfp pilus assembly protein PilN